MKAIENTGLETISNIIVERISTSSIYCFGEKKNMQSVVNPFSENSSKKSKHTHLYLMVLTDEYIINAISDISDIIKTKTDGRYTVTLVFCKAKYGHHLSQTQLYIYHQAVTKGYKIYERADMPLNIIYSEIPKRKVAYTRSYWKNRTIIAENFLSSMNQVDYTRYGFVQESMAHTAVEQICLGLINVFLGFYPDHFSLAYLFDICEIFTPLTSDLFPRATSEDKRLFDLLKTNPSSLRWTKVKDSLLLDTEHLERRCSLFYDKACALVEAELVRLENENKDES